ncbi:hypothetical protein JCM10296v2_004574 [Rhodotorula toruloides]
MATAAPAAATVPAPGQSVQPKLASFALKESHSYELVCDLVLDLTDPGLSASLPLPDVHFLGDWTCDVERRGEDVNYSGFATTLTKKNLDKLSAEAAGSLDIATQRLYRVVFSLKPAAPIRTSDTDTILHRLPIRLMYSPYDVRLFFPRVQEGGAELWANSGFLSESSPYLKTLLASDFAESVTVLRKRPRVDGEHAGETQHDEASEADFSDSDDAADRDFFEEHPPKLHEVDDDSSVQYKQVKVTKAAFSTYRAVLAHLRTGTITFAPLPSNCKPNSSKVAYTAGEYRTKFTKSSLPRPVSPKSTFRLAHLLELSALQQECLRHLSAVLRPESAPDELISSTAKLHDDWRKVISEYVVENWDEVVKAGSLSSIEGNFKRGEIQEAGPALLEMYQRKLATESK